jgi:two-component system response regulator PilR (NtrC family)
MKSVLIVDDEYLIRWALKEGLKQKYRMLTASGVEEALKILDADRVDAVITDIRMPIRSGIDLVKHLRGNRPGVKIFAITAAGSDDDLRRCYDLEVISVLRKPLELPVIRALLDRHVTC